MKSLRLLKWKFKKKISMNGTMDMATIMLIFHVRVFYLAASLLALASIRALVTSINTAAIITRPITIY